MRILIPLAEGFEEMEAVIAIDMLRRFGTETVTAAIAPARLAKGSRGIEMNADTLWQDADPATFDALVIPGGQPGVDNLRADGRVAALAADFHARKKLTAAICAAPLVLHDAGILQGRRFTCYPSCEKEITEGVYTAGRVTEDGTIITGCGPGAGFAFALAVGTFLMGGDAAANVAAAACIPGR